MAARIQVPKFSSGKPFERCKTEIEIWSEATDITTAKQGLVVALSLPEDDSSQIRDKVFTEVPKDILKSETVLNELLTYLVRTVW